MSNEREQLARQDGRTAAVAMVVGFLCLVLGGMFWVDAARSNHADAVAVGQILVLLSQVFFLGSMAYGLSARYWRHGGRGDGA